MTWRQLFPDLARAFEESDGFTVTFYLRSGRIFKELALILPLAGHEAFSGVPTDDTENRPPINIPFDAIEAIAIHDY